MTAIHGMGAAARGHQYIFIDPIARIDSGISSYVHNAVQLLLKRGLDVKVLPKETGEPIERYRRRVAEYVRGEKKRGFKIVVEAPESGAATSDISNDDAEIHIRIHCSKNLGALVQGQPVDNRSLRLEQQEIDRASYLSAPSTSAVVASRTVLRMPTAICCYPNPAPSWPELSVLRDQIRPDCALFVGRLHPLKGAHWLSPLANRLPDIPFRAVTPFESGSLKPERNLSFVDGNSADRLANYLNARLVIIPSLFETASMVGIEALAAGIPIVSWSHLGITEYAPSPEINAVEAWDIDAFSREIARIFRNGKRPVSETDIGVQFNELYLKGFKATMEGGKGNFMPIGIDKNTSNVIDRLTKDRATAALALPESMPRWRRKMRKLRRDPAQFIKDSWLGYFASTDIAPSAGLKKHSEDVRPEHEEMTTKPNETALADIGERGSAGEKNTTPPKEPVGPTDEKRIVKKEPLPAIFTKIGAAGRIEFGEPPSKPEGLITAFLYPEDRKEDAAVILSRLGTFQDFRYVQQPFLQIGTFQSKSNTAAVEIVERIDLKNKKLISSVDYIIMLDPPSVLVHGLRASGTRQRTVVISSGKEQLPDPWHTDVLILVSDKDLPDPNDVYRRKIVVKDSSQLHFAIRRAVQEGTPKNPDMLLPLLGFHGNHRDELLAVDVRFFQGVVRVPSRFSPKGTNMEELCLQMADKAKALAVTESVYLRYRSLCDRTADKNILARLLSFCLYDGVIFDVRA